MENIDLDFNYAALVLSILTDASPEEAFIRLERGLTPENRVVRTDITVEDSIEMYRLNRIQKVSYRKIGEMYGVKQGFVIARVRRITEKIKKGEIKL